MAKSNLVRVLCLIRDEQIYNVLTTILPPHGVEPRLAEDAETAHIALRQRPLHAVLVQSDFIKDFGVPVIADLRKRTARSIRFVFLGGLEARDHPHIMRPSVDRVLWTPVTIKEIVSALKTPRPAPRRWDIQTRGLPA